MLEDRWLFSTLTVSSASDSGSGSLRAEIAAAQSGDTIVFAASLNGKTITLTSGELDLTKNLTIQGPGASQLTIRSNYTSSTTHASRVFEVAPNTTVTLSGMTITNGDGVSVESFSSWVNYGGAILNHGTLTITCSTLTNNGAIDGGAIFSDGTLTITGSTLSDNAAAYGGGIYNAGTATVSDGTALSDNGASYGGGIYNGGALTVQGQVLCPVTLPVGVAALALAL